MNRENNSKIKRFKQKILSESLTRVFIEMAAFAAAFWILYFIGRAIFGIWTWRSDETIYIIFKMFERNILLIAVLTGLIGFFIILIRSWSKTLGYLEDVLNATENIYNEKNDLIELPLQLKEVENQMNQIKLNVKENERIAKEAEQRKNDLIVYLAHDLKTPLTSVIGYLTLLRDENQISAELREKYLSISLEKAERLEELINEFFEISRFNLSNLTLELCRVNLTRMLEQLTYEFKPMLSSKNLVCTLTVAPDLTIRCDVNKLQRVFDNLLRNAVNYSFENSTIEITVIQLENEVKLNFINKGNTIPKEKLDRIFDQFYRLDSARTTKSGGAGLGLAIAKQIVELHGGRIAAYSEDETITFACTLPVL